MIPIRARGGADVVESRMMAYRLRRLEKVGVGIRRGGLRRVGRAEIEGAVEVLRGGGDRDEAIHEARKGMKRIRAVLRLVRDGLGERYRLENARYRDLGRKLSGLRDAGALLEAFAAIEEEAGEKFGGVRAALEEYKRRCEAAVDPAAAMEEAAAGLEAARGDVAAWRGIGDGFAAIEPGLRRTARDARRAWRRAEHSGAPEDFHEWRKRAKDHWHQLRLLDGMGVEALRRYAGRVKKMEQRLGDEHNVTVLEQVMRDDAELFAPGEERAGVERAARALREKLRREAVKLAAEVWGPKTGEFIGVVEHWWEAWRGERALEWERRVGLEERGGRRRDVDPR
jgi:CHAD domain-containing protein